MSRRARVSGKWLSAAYVGTLLSILFAVFISLGFFQDISGFQSCNVNSSDLSVSSCGKSSINTGDALLLTLALCSILLVLALITQSYRLTKRFMYK